MPDIGTYGIYRQDGKALADASVFYEDSWQPDSSRWLPLWFNGAAPTPCWINGTAPPKAEYRLMDAPWYNKTNFERAPEERQMERPLVLKHAVPGDYVFWFSLMGWGENQGWPENVEADTLQVTIRVSLLITAAEDRFHQEERLAYLFHGGPRPANLADNSLYRTYKIDIPLTLHRDGWVFDHVQIVPWKKEVDQKRLTQGEVATDIEAQTKVGARSATMSLKTTTSVNRNGNQPQVICRDAFAWDATLPPSIDDRNVADVLIGGSEQHQWDPKEPLIRSLLLASWQGSAYESPDPCRYDDGIDLIRATGSEEKKTEFDLRRTGSKEEHERWWFNDPRPARQAPGPGQEPYRRRYYCGPPWHKAPQETLGAKLLINLWLGPWNVNGYYRRRSEGSTATLAAPGSGGPVEVVQNEDPFWKWYAAFSRLLREQLSKVELAKAEAGLIGLNLEEALRSNAILLELLTDPDNQTSDAYFNRILKSEQSLAQQIRDHRQRIDALSGETRSVYNQILEKIEEGFDKFGAEHPELLLWEREYRDQRDQSPFSLAGAAGDIQALRKAAAQAEVEGLSAQSRLIEADLLRRTGDPVGALYALREAARIDPEDGEVKQALTEAECAFLKTAIEKSQGAIQAARAAFYGYLLERGFGSADVNPHGEYHWYSFLANPLSQLDSESAWAIFSTGVAGSLSGIFGKPEAEAELLKVTETQMTTAFLGLHTMLRLRLRGHSLVEIQAMSSEQMRAWLPLKDLNGQPFTDQQLHSLGVAVREALKLRDVQALVADDRIGLQLGLKNSYWDARDVGDTWRRRFGHTCGGRGGQRVNDRVLPQR